MIYRIIDAKKAGHKITVSCKLLGVSPSGYFAWKKRGCERRRVCRERRVSGMTFKKMASAPAATASPV